MSQSCNAAKKCTKKRAACVKFVALAPYFCDPEILLPWSRDVTLLSITLRLSGELALVPSRQHESAN